MTDVVDPATRSRMMAGIRSKNTKPELLLRSLLHRKGLRFRLHQKQLPGRPDIVFPRFRSVIFVHGCFWHGHCCKLFRLPSTRTDFWRDKIQGNRARDLAQVEMLRLSGWRTLVVWECAIRGHSHLSVDELVDCIVDWLKSGVGSAQIDAGGIHG